jgi:hypothetical protein
MPRSYFFPMAEIRTITTLRSKRTEIIAAIANYEKRLSQARADLAHITAAITIFEASGDIEDIPPYVDIHRCFKRGEVISLCKEAFASGPLNTRQLDLRVMGRKGPRYRRQGTREGRCWTSHSRAAPAMPARAHRRDGKAFGSEGLGFAGVTKSESHRFRERDGILT